MNTTSNQTEQQIYKSWEEKGYFKADPSSDKKPYSLLMPPPNLTGDPHLGHAMQHAILDALARFRRMQGYDVLLLPGVDHAGIQFEGTLTKKLDKEGKNKYHMGREEYLKEAWKFKDEVYQSFHGTWSVFGISADWSKEVFTLEEKVQKAVVQEFKTYWDQDLLYKGAYIVQWCPKCGTAIEDVEMEYDERTEKLYFVNYVIEGEQDVITVATARPETIAADVAIAIYPGHPKFAKLLGKLAINPFTNTQIPIIEDERVEKDFGTGALKITPGHDLLDYQIGQTHGLPILHAVGKDGKITSLDPLLAGLRVEEARHKAAEILQEKGLIDHIEDYTHSVPLCERSKNPVEPLISEEWFVRMTPLAQKALKQIDEINFAPQNYKDMLSKWMEEIHDWCISRSQWWGHRIPVWYCQKCNPHHLVGKDKDMIISLTHPDQKCQTCGLADWIQDEQVLDTWFSSGLWPMATLGWPEQTSELGKYHPFDFEITAPEIRYLWIARMIMLSVWFTDKIPFKNMFFHGTLRAMDGKKMSKSLGNGVDPKDLLNQWGTDATRMLLYSYSAPGRDGRLNRQLADERCKNFRNFGTKLRNIHRFIMELKPEDAATESDFSHPDDAEIISQLKTLIQNVTQNIEGFNMHLATDNIYEFVWHVFADKYIEQTKTRRAEAQPCLEYVLKTSLELLHPFMPFVTEELWQKMPHEGDSIMIAAWPSQ
jgi:valyl-tRNA synthetase